MNIRSKPGVRWVPFYVFPGLIIHGLHVDETGYYLRKGIHVDARYLHKIKRTAIAECLRRNRPEQPELNLGEYDATND